jgi:hypothetical protein
VMSTNKSRKKGTVTTAARNGRMVASSVLNRLAPGEVASVLQILLDRHPNLTREAQEIAAGLVSSASVEDIADDVCTSITSLDMDDLHGRAGKHSWGYVEPAQAAQDLLEEAVAGHLDDMKRRMHLGLDAGAESVCAGIVLGLFRASRQKSGGILEWATDFPAEHAGYVIEEYLAAYPKSKRRNVGGRLSAALAASVSEWSDMIFRITKRSPQR